MTGSAAGSEYIIRGYAGDMKAALSLLNERLREEEDPASRYEEWRKVVAAKATEFPMWYPQRDDVIIPQWAIEVPTPLPTHPPCYAQPACGSATSC
jgi:hypothetical protein